MHALIYHGYRVAQSHLANDHPAGRLTPQMLAISKFAPVTSASLWQASRRRWRLIGTVTECAEDLDVALVELRVQSRNSIPWFTPFRRSLEFTSVLAPSALSGKSLLVAYRHTGVGECSLDLPSGNGLIRIRHGHSGQPDSRNAPVVGSPVFTLEGELVGMVTSHVSGGSWVLPIGRILSRFNVALVR